MVTPNRLRPVRERSSIKFYGVKIINYLKGSKTIFTEVNLGWREFFAALSTLKCFDVIIFLEFDLLLLWRYGLISDINILLIFLF